LLDLVIKHSTDADPTMAKFLIIARALIAHFNRSSNAQNDLKDIFEECRIEEEDQIHSHK
jgi:hypothetical protein